MDLSQHIRTIPDFPKPGILFYDISTLLIHPEGWQATVERLAEAIAPHEPDVLVGIESRGFLVAAPLALKLGLGFMMVRKKGKLPGSKISVSYTLEYGEDSMEIHDDALHAGGRVLLIDDLLATGGTAEAGIKLIEQLGGEIVAAAFVVDLPASKTSVTVPAEFLAPGTEYAFEILAEEASGNKTITESDFETTE